jgi:Zn-dependent protease with chaperone function
MLGSSVFTLVVALALYLRLLDSKSVSEAEKKCKAVFVTVYVSLLFTALSVLNRSILDATIYIPVLFITTQSLIGLFFDRRAEGFVRFEIGEDVYTVRLLGKRRITAFTLVLNKKMYASSYLVRALTPQEISSIMAHEAGHINAFKPIPVSLAMIVYVSLLALSISGAINMALDGYIHYSAIALLAAFYAWVIFSWTWEHIADIYAYKYTGLSAVLVLQKITRTTPAKPSIADIVVSILKSLKPTRAGGPLVNPHPPPSIRLWLLLNIATSSPH